jgi:hypothetical protein
MFRFVIEGCSRTYSIMFSGMPERPNPLLLSQFLLFPGLGQFGKRGVKGGELTPP